jgi:uncharacterized membrane protein
VYRDAGHLGGRIVSDPTPADDHRSTGGAGWARDLVLVVAVVLLTNVVLFGVGVPDLVLWLLGVPFLVVLPGYAVVSALFPEDSGRLDRGEAAHPWHEPDHLVRLALSLVSSAVILAVVGVALSSASAISTGPVAVSVSIVTLAGVAVAAVRRKALDPSERAMPFGDDSRVWGRLSSGSGVQNALAVVALLALLGTLAVTGAAPPAGDSYTEFYVLSEDDNGTLSAQTFPETFTAGENETLHVGIENAEGATTDYEVVVLAQAVDENGSVIIQQRVDRFETTLEPGANETIERSIAPTIVGEEIRLRFLLYEGSAPDSPSKATADESLQVWTDVVDG